MKNLKISHWCAGIATLSLLFILSSCTQLREVSFSSEVEVSKGTENKIELPQNITIGSDQGLIIVVIDGDQYGLEEDISTLFDVNTGTLEFSYFDSDSIEVTKTILVPEKNRKSVFELYLNSK